MYLKIFVFKTVAEVICEVLHERYSVQHW